MGSVYNLAAGEARFGEIAADVAEVLELGSAVSVTVEDSVEALGPLYGLAITIAARAAGTKAVEELGWRP